MGGKNKEQTNNMAWVNSNARRASCDTSICLCRLSLTCNFCEISTSLEDPISGRLVSLLSGVDSQLPLSVARRQLTSLSSLSNSSDWRSLPTSGRVEISSPNPLCGFVPKQAKGSSAWRTTYIVSHIYLSYFIHYLFICPSYLIDIYINLFLIFLF